MQELNSKNELIYKYLDNIYEHLKCKELFDSSIYGDLPALLFLLEYAQIKGEPTLSYLSAFERTINSYSRKDQETLAEGYVSLDICQNTLFKYGFVQYSHDFHESVVLIAIQSGYKLLSIHNLDFLYGATGIVHYLLNYSDTTSFEVTSFIDTYVEYLAANYICENGGLRWNDYFFRIQYQQLATNLGLAHGIVAILKVLLGIRMHKNVCSSDIDFLIKGIISFIISSSNVNLSIGSRLPNSVIANSRKDDFSRLSWCYGDLSSGIILYQAGSDLNDEDVRHFARALITGSEKRRNVIETGIRDAGVCHGSSGVSYLFKKAYKIIGEERLRSAEKYWLNRTIAFGLKEGTKIKYCRTSLSGDVEECNDSLLEGYTGIALVLLSELTEREYLNYILNIQ